MAHVQHKLSNSLEGALAGGGDPATSPLYVFGPFLRLIVVAGVAQITFGTTVWLVVFTIMMVSAMYRLVMRWVTDGSGGSGLNEEEFGPWAVKVNAAITFIEYTLTFLVSMAAMVTFIADRFPLLNESLLGIQYRAYVAIALSLLTGWLVNRGPKVAARAFGPATAGVLILLWVMVFSTIFQFGFRLPSINLQALSPEYLGFTFGGFARILAVMTGIEVFANLVAAYGGTPEQKSRKAFGSLVIIMGTAAVTMLIVGPAIFQVSDPTNTEVSVFTQTMDFLLPPVLAYAGTFIGVVVLLSASAASAQGLQNLALGLKDRHYVPAYIGQQNRFGVADKPVWIEVAIVIVAFLAFGTNEETYLAIYAAGVFILLSMTGWAASKRLRRELKEGDASAGYMTLIGTIVAATLTTIATVIIFSERFFEGAWTYFLFIPLLFAAFSYFRRALGPPTAEMDELGQLERAMVGGFGYGQAEPSLEPSQAALLEGAEAFAQEGIAHRTTEFEWKDVEHILVPLDGSDFAERSLRLASYISKAYEAKVTLLTIVPDRESGFRFISSLSSSLGNGAEKNQKYLETVAHRMQSEGLRVDARVERGPVAETIHQYAVENAVDLIVINTHGRAGVQEWLIGSVTNTIVQIGKIPVLLTNPSTSNGKPPSSFDKLLVILDGTEDGEQILPYIRELAIADNSEVILLSVPPVPEVTQYGSALERLVVLRGQAESALDSYLRDISNQLEEEGIKVRSIVQGSGTARTVAEISTAEQVSVIMLTTHGRDRRERLFEGSITERIVQGVSCPVFLVPIDTEASAVEYTPADRTEAPS